MAINVQETQAETVEYPSVIVLPAIVVSDDDSGQIIGTGGLSLDPVVKRNYKTGESTATGATRLMATFTPASKDDRRFSVRWRDLKAMYLALAPEFSDDDDDAPEDGE